MKRIALLLASLFVLAGCNTVHGFGEDLHNLGNSISNAASK
jgi:entericidin A